ncbi:MAG: hypothetical protein JWR59_500, partial [Brevundimonas sp.]|nr:hypothetical protein [Brevundimonas sp.]
MTALTDRGEPAPDIGAQTRRSFAGGTAALGVFTAIPALAQTAP